MTKTPVTETPEVTPGTPEATPTATPTPDAPVNDAPATPAAPTSEISMKDLLAFAAANPAKFAELFPGKAMPAPRPKSAIDWQREVDFALVEYAANLVAGMVPAEHQAVVARKVANQLHHLSTPTIGWPEGLPRPERSDWR